MLFYFCSQAIRGLSLGGARSSQWGTGGVRLPLRSALPECSGQDQIPDQMGVLKDISHKNHLDVALMSVSDPDIFIWLFGSAIDFKVSLYLVTRVITVSKSSVWMKCLISSHQCSLVVPAGCCSSHFFNECDQGCAAQQHSIIIIIYLKRKNNSKLKYQIKNVQ